MVDIPYDKVNDTDNWDWEAHPAGWYETVGFIGPSIGAWDKYLEADSKAKEGEQ